jgi:hypothetical protein
MNDERTRILMEAVIVSLKVLHLHLLEKTYENHENPQ